DLNAVVRDAVALHKLEIVERRGRVDVEPLPTVWADHDLLVRAVSNLINNSIKYATDEPQISIAARQLDGKVELCITDNGPGIPAQSAISAFEPLVRLNTKVRADGSGLGLTICKTILQSMGGSIRLDTGYTFGARFIMQLRDGPR
ncbi:MAG: ATP-binding protein, partial [Myxococcota bacterium]